MERIENTCDEAVRNNAEALFIYYTGHGCKNTGNWVTAKPPNKKIFKQSEWNIKLVEVFEKIKLSGFKNNVIIVTDCCYSGQWCYDADALMSDKETKLEVQSLAMSSSCSRDKEARWGAYSKMKEVTSKADLN